MHYAKVIFADGICRAYIGAYRVITMHANLYGSLNSYRSLHIIHMYHGLLPVCFTFGAGRFTGFATNATLHVHKKFHVSLVIRACHAIFFCDELFKYFYKHSYPAAREPLFAMELTYRHIL